MPSTPIESRRWRHQVTGATASPYGAVPWLSESDRFNWQLEVTGWTVKNEDGTIGIGRQPFATCDEAQAWCDANPRFRGMARD